MNVYRIRNNKTGLFSTGGLLYPGFSKKGKIYSRVGDAKSNVTQVLKSRLWEKYKGCEIVEYKFTEVENEKLKNLIKNKIVEKSLEKL